MQLISLPYQRNSAELFSSIAHLPWAIFLDSGQPYSTQGRYDIMSALPYKTLETFGQITQLSQGNKARTLETDPFLILKSELLNHYTEFPISPSEDLPFLGGALGYLSYDLARRLEKLPILAKDDLKTPEMAIGIYHWALIVDHLKQKTHLMICERQTASNMPTAKEILSLFKQKNKNLQPFRLLSEIQADTPKKDYLNAFKQIKRYLYQGDCYQVNLTQRFSASFAGSAWALYQELRQHNPAPFSVFFNTPALRILSFSPERFLKIHNGSVETKPIKGTRPRNLSNPIQDEVFKEELRTNSKERSENLMIVDLLRNDLSKMCRLGSIKVPKLFAIESFSSVHHLVSTITGALGPGCHSIDLIRACFPGGSIIGAPKLRAMEIIEELEPFRRGVYCGSIGYINYNGNSDFNIGIRTLIMKENRLFYHAGGAITMASDAEAEYQECFDKIAIISRVLKRFQHNFQTSIHNYKN